MSDDSSATLLFNGSTRTVQVGETHWMRSRDCLLYSQDSISATFRDGSRLNSQLCHMRREYKINAVIHDGHLYALNNRTLYAAKHFDKVGSPTWVEVNIVEKPYDWEQRFTTKNGGGEIEVRGNPDNCCTM
eukprot:TRINITY_DN75004_c0_g1_i1.p1 TRINITY_DN75004_c0_g1~~TRINITY_DN75004_c0_g1_i1.p1  ORF type:complete len:131 (+),score=7.22 TRINITY_DN75004_c0_g1_i1:79-471(+)